MANNQSCGSCDRCFLNADARYECQALPPSITFFPPLVEKKRIGGKLMEIQTAAKSATGYPIVSPNWGRGCIHYKMKIEALGI